MSETSASPLTVRIEQFEGPLDLLLFLIQSHELDISKVSISKITDQYLSYIRVMNELNFDFASDFLVMAATLIVWKSRAILPQEDQPDATEGLDDELMTPEQLVQQLLEHQRFLSMGQELAVRPHLNEDVFARSNQKPPVEKIWREMNVTDLSLSFQDILVRSRKRKKVLKKETVSLSDKIAEFGTRLKLGEQTELRKLLSIDPDRSEIVVTFLASLELSRLKMMKVLQNDIYQPIYLELLRSLDNFDYNLASGFAPEIPPPVENTVSL